MVIIIDDNESSDEDEVKGIEHSLPVTQSNEFSKYLSMKIDMDEFSSDILTLWENNASEFSCLSRIARQIHSIPAMSAAVERQFNTAGLMLSERRNGLDPE